MSSDAKPGEIGASASRGIYIRKSDGAVVVWSVFAGDLQVAKEHWRTLLYAPVYESIVRELADAKRFGPHHNSISLPELVIRLHLRAREALGVEE